MSVSNKIILRTTKQLSNGECPIMLRITINRQSQFISIKKSSAPEQWNEKTQQVSRSHPDHLTINPLLRNISSKVDLYLLNAGENDTVVSFDDIKNIVLKLTNTNKEIKSFSLFSYFEQEIDRLKEADRLGYAATYRSTLLSLQRFTGNKDYPFINLSIDFLRKYEAFLVKRGNAVTTRSVFFRTFRTLWRSAITDKFCPGNHYPFKNFAFSKYNNPRTKKRAITKAQITQIMELEIDVQDDGKINSRNYFLFMFYCRGLNFTDLAGLKWENIVDGELHYTRAKTKEDFQFKMHPAALGILNYYSELEGNSDAGYILPILYKRHNTAKTIRYRKQKVLKMVNNDIKALASSVGIEKHVTTYVARHSYATILRVSGVSKEIIGQSLGHDSLKTTQIYLDDIGDPVVDEMINAAI
jgi:integrase/recombinase XerD